MNQIQLKTLSFHFFLCFLFFSAHAQKQNFPIADQIQLHQQYFKKLPVTELLKALPDQTVRKAALQNEVSEATFFSLQSNKVNQLLQQPEQFLEISLPVNGAGPIDLQLYKAQVFSPEFKVSTASNPNTAYPYQTGVYYWGIVKGNPKSLAALSINQDEVMGFVSVGGDHYVIGRLNESEEGTHIVYRDEDLKLTPGISCYTDDDLHDKGTKDQPSAQKSPDNCVKMYIEVDYDIFVGKGGVTQAADYVAGAFSQVAILYANESVNFTVNEIKVWDTTDPYTGPTTSDYLSQFRTQMGGNFNGDLAHLVGYQGSGGIAYVDVLCNSNYGVGYSDINASYANVPTYSWTIEVLTHEIGHNLGSKHTHACVWNGNNTAIDGCGPAAGYSEGCNAPVPAAGTIMSYCHLVGGVGIDFNLGFGPQPGDRIRSEVYNATCLGTCPSNTPDDAGLSIVNVPTGIICTNSIDPEVVLFNYGTNNLTSVTIEYQIDGGTVSSYAWSGNLGSNSSVAVTLPAITYTNGFHTFEAQTVLPNGNADSNNANNGAGSTFTRVADETYYADIDGDGYGDPNNTIIDCVQPAGYVLDNTDCNDNDETVYPGAPCNDNDTCTINDVLDANCQCAGTYADSDSDGVCDGNDICPGGNDTIDSDGDGIPDYCDCNLASLPFSSNPLTHSGSGSSSSSVGFATDSKDPFFVISGLDAKTNGNPNNRYIEQVVVTYLDGNGNTQTYGTFNGDITAIVNVDITGEVQSVSVSLQNGYGNNYGGALSVSLSPVDYCNGCNDSDSDGICNAEDVCPGFDDNLIGTACDDNDACTVNDVYGTNCQCTGTLTGDSDNDGVCDAEDVCPGGDDTVDSDGDGIPDDCDNINCANEITSTFSTIPLNHQGTGSSSSQVTFPADNADVSFTISNLDAKTNGNPGKRYIDEVTVSYVDGSGNTQTEGVYRGDVQSSASISIPGEVQSVTLSLTDVYDGDTGSEIISIDMSDVSSCVTTSTIFQNGGYETEEALPASVYPNPATGEAFVKFSEIQEKTEVIVSNMLGKQVARYTVEGQSALRIDLHSMKLGDQTLFVNIRIPGKQPFTKRLVIIR